MLKPKMGVCEFIYMCRYTHVCKMVFYSCNINRLLRMCNSGKKKIIEDKNYIGMRG